MLARITPGARVVIGLLVVLLVVLHGIWHHWFLVDWITIALLVVALAATITVVRKE